MESRLDDDSSYSYGIEGDNCSKRSGLNWPFYKSQTPWETGDQFFDDAMLMYADRIKERKTKMEAVIMNYVPTEGAYVGFHGHYYKMTHKPKDNNGIYTIRISPDGSRYIVGYENARIEEINSKNEVTRIVKHSSARCGATTSIKYAPSSNDSFYFTTTNGRIYQAVLISEDGDKTEDKTWETKKIITEGRNKIYGMDITSTGEKMITGGQDSRIRIYDLEMQDMITCYKGYTLECKDSYSRLLEEGEEEGHYLPIYSIAHHPDNPHLFASGGLDSSVKLWDLRVSQFAVRNIFGPHLMGDAIDLKDTTVLTGQWSAKDSIQIWDSGSCRLLKTFRPPNMSPQTFGQYVYYAKFIKAPLSAVEGDLFMAGGSGLGGLLVGSINENIVVTLFEDSETILCADNHDNTIVYGGTSQILYTSKVFKETERFSTEGSIFSRHQRCETSNLCELENKLSSL